MATKNHQYPLLLVVVSVVLIWGYFFSQGIVTAFELWLSSEIYNHCALVLPGVGYLIWRQRAELLSQQMSISLVALPIVFLTVVLYLFALAGGINVLMHIATFIALPALLWSVIGNKAAKVIHLPLLFILFAIPIGDQIVPFLQDITTDMAVPLLEMSQVPVFRNGLYIDIPGGKFLVAEACSGISFLISSIVFSCFYAYISFAKTKKRLIFVFVAVLLPILANALRVYGIIMIGHLTDMEYAVGADHLIYGGVFFAFILFLLILGGERYRDVDWFKVESSPSQQSGKAHYNGHYAILSAYCILFVSASIWAISIERESIAFSPQLTETQKFDSSAFYPSSVPNWQPKLGAPSRSVQGVLEQGPFAYAGLYSGQNNELISSSYRLFNQQRWTLLSSGTISVLENQYSYMRLSSHTGNKRYLVSWYEVDGKHLAKDSETKLYQAYKAMLKQPSAGIRYVLLYDERFEISDITDDLIKQSGSYRNQLYLAIVEQFKRDSGE